MPPKPHPTDFRSRQDFEAAMYDWEKRYYDYQRYQQFAAPPKMLYPSVDWIGALAEKPVPPKPQFDVKKIESLKTVAPRKVTAPVPDMVAPIVGWRAWKVNGRELRALGKSTAWEPKKMIAATCSEGHKDAPIKSCNCGIWAFKSLDILVKALTAGHYEMSVFGEVSLWGRVIETENGFRSQFAYPKELWLLDETLEHLGYTYGVPVRTA